jgi:hypothetical protein
MFKQFAISIFFLIMFITGFTHFVFALDVFSADKIIINGMEAYPSSDSINVNAGEDIKIQVVFTALQDAEDARIKSYLVESNPLIIYSTYRFDLIQGATYSKTLTLNLPEDLQEGDYTIKLTFSNNGLNRLERIVKIHINKPDIALVPEFNLNILIFTLIGAMLVFMLVRKGRCK